MRKKIRILLCLIFCVLLLSSLNAQQTTTDDNRKPSIEERLIRLEEGQKDFNNQIDYLKIQINNRFDDLTANFNWLYILLASIIVLNGVMVGSVVWLARQDRPIAQRHYDLINQREAELERQVRSLSADIDFIKNRLELTE